MAFSSESVTITLPLSELSAFVSDFSAGLSAPLPSISSGHDFGWVASVEAPAAEISTTILPGGALSGALSAARVLISATVTKPSSGNAEAPSPTIAGMIFPEIVWDVALQAALPEVAGLWETVPASSFDTWVLNANNLGHSSYNNFDFNSMFFYRGHYYGCRADGVYRLSGTTDDGVVIAAKTVHGVTSFGSDKVKRIDSVYPSAKAAAECSIQVGLSADESAAVYSTETLSAGEHKPIRNKFGRGINGRYWTIETLNVAGSRFTVHSHKVVVVPLSRRV